MQRPVAVDMYDVLSSGSADQARRFFPRQQRVEAGLVRHWTRSARTRVPKVTSAESRTDCVKIAGDDPKCWTSLTLEQKLSINPRSGHFSSGLTSSTCPLRPSTRTTRRGPSCAWQTRPTTQTSEKEGKIKEEQ